MKAKDVQGQAPGGQRTKLANVLPLDTPLVIQMFPIYACNFKCNYCVFSSDKDKRGFISDKIVMDFGLYCKCMDEIAGFPAKLKCLRYVGMGEPLLHPRIADMVAYAAGKNVAERLEILTNASLLTPARSDALIEAGLSRLVVSLQGTTAEKYRSVCGTAIDFVEFRSNLRYYFEHKGQGQLHIKIIDYALEGEADEKRFYELFGDICDTIGVEHAGPIFPYVNYGEVLKERDTSVTQFGLDVSEVRVCPQPFFTLQINPDGKVVPCYSIVYPGIMGDCNDQSVPEIWNGPTYQRFRRAMLDGLACASGVCAECEIIRHRLFPEDSLNDDLERLRKCYEVEPPLLGEALRG
jgi:radical SAM protein with 4Fe4S-binding SPASM domain